MATGIRLWGKDVSPQWAFLMCELCVGLLATSTEKTAQLRVVAALVYKFVPWEAQSSPRVARESWGLRSSHCRAGDSPAGGPLLCLVCDLEFRRVLLPISLVFSILLFSSISLH